MTETEVLCCCPSGTSVLLHKTQANLLQGRGKGGAERGSPGEQGVPGGAGVGMKTGTQTGATFWWNTSGYSLTSFLFSLSLNLVICPTGITQYLVHWVDMRVQQVNPREMIGILIGTEVL